MDVAAANYTSAASAYDQAAADAEKALVTAPSAGVVTSLDIAEGGSVTAGSSSGSSSSSSGGTASSASGGTSSGGTSGGTSSSSGLSSSSGSSSSGSEALVISDYSSVKVTVTVSEVDISKLKLGQKAALTFDALSSTPVTGTVTWISPNASTSSGVVSYEVAITPDAKNTAIKPGMSASADIQTRVARNVIVVPNAAIKLDGTTKYVQVLGTNGQATRVNVKTGVADDSVTQITTGLAEGATVVNGSTAAASTSSTSSQSGGGLLMGGGGPPSGSPPSGGGGN